MAVAKKQAKDIEFYRGRSFTLKIYMAKMRDIRNGKNVILVNLSVEALQQRTIDNILKIEVQKQRKTILELKVKLMSQEDSKACTKKKMKGCKEQQ